MKAETASSDTQGLIAIEMGRVLASEPLDADTDFFVAGGDSLRAVELIDRVVDRFRDVVSDDGKELTSALLLTMFDDASPSALAAVVDAHILPGAA